MTRLVEAVHGARLNPHDPQGQMAESLLRQDVSRDDLGDDLDDAVGSALIFVEALSPGWQQNIRDAATGLDDLVRAEVVVMLEGPDNLAELAEQLRRRALLVEVRWGVTASAPFGRSIGPELELSPRDMHARLNAAIQEFTQAARAHLNAQ